MSPSISAGLSLHDKVVKGVLYVARCDSVSGIPVVDAQWASDLWWLGEAALFYRSQFLAPHRRLWKRQGGDILSYRDCRVAKHDTQPPQKGLIDQRPISNTPMARGSRNRQFKLLAVLHLRHPLPSPSHSSLCSPQAAQGAISSWQSTCLGFRPCISLRGPALLFPALSECAVF